MVVSSAQRQPHGSFSDGPLLELRVRQVWLTDIRLLCPLINGLPHDSSHIPPCTLGCTSLLAGGRSRTYLDSERNRCTGDMSPPSDNVIFDNQCYATTPSSSNGNSDMEQPNHCNSRRCNGGQTYQQQNMQSVSTPGSPTSRLLLEYEMHLRNTLAKGMDAESYSLRTFEALLTQSMENLGKTPFKLQY